MPIKYFICPDKIRIETHDCLKENGCRLGSRCSTRAYLQLIKSDRPWTGKPSTTQLLQGTLYSFLKLTKEYAVYPDSRAFMVTGSKGHSTLEVEDDYSIMEEKFNDVDTEVTGIADLMEIENDRRILVDYKVSGSYKVAKALGFYVDEEPTGEIYKSGKKKGEQKTRKILKRSDDKIDRKTWELQLNKYRIEFEKRGFKADELKIQCIVRDGNTYIARSRGVFRNIYYFNIPILQDEYVNNYFTQKKDDLLLALKQGYWNDICTKEENWDGLKCQNYCDVAEFCKYGKYLKHEKEIEEMAIKGLSEIRRLPRLGKIRLGIKKKTSTGVEYPSEVDYFILDPQTPSELENTKIIEEFEKLYGEKPKSISIMFPVANPDVYFPQFYKRYGSSTALKCKGNGETASCGTEDFAQGLEKIGKDEMGLPIVVCKGKECIYYQKKECTEVGVLQILLPELPGAGVWQISTGSYNSIVNLNSCIDYVTSVCGRAHMIPLTLERRMQEIPHEGKKTKHYILHINMDFKLVDLQKYAMIEPTKMLLELPAPEVEKDDILYQQNVIIDIAPENLQPTKEQEPKPQKKDEPMSDAQNKKLFAMMKESQLPDEFRVWLKTRYKDNMIKKGEHQVFTKSIVITIFDIWSDLINEFKNLMIACPEGSDVPKSKCESCQSREKCPSWDITR